jgi:hypothetical protein
MFEDIERSGMLWIDLGLRSVTHEQTRSSPKCSSRTDAPLS